MKRCRAVSATVTSSLDAMSSDTIASAEASSVDQAYVFSSFSITVREDTRENREEFVKNTYARLPVVHAISSFKEWYDPRLRKLVEKVTSIET